MARLLAEALLPLKKWVGDTVQEREILRAAGGFGAIDAGAAGAAVDRARRMVLKWAEKRIGARLPDAA